MEDGEWDAAFGGAPMVGDLVRLLHSKTCTSNLLDIFSADLQTPLQIATSWQFCM